MIDTNKAPECLVAGLELATDKFRAYFFDIAEKHMKKVEAQYCFADETFIQGIELVKTDPKAIHTLDKVYALSLWLVFDTCLTMWADIMERAQSCGAHVDTYTAECTFITAAKTKLHELQKSV